MVLGKILIPFTVLALSLSGLGAGNAAVETAAVRTGDAAAETATVPAGSQELEEKNTKGESDFTYRVFSTEAVASMSTVTIDGKKYTMPIKAKQLTKNGWTVSETSKQAPGKSGEKLLTVEKGDRKFEAREDKSGNIAGLTEKDSGMDALVLPGGITSDLEEKEFLARLGKIPSVWKDVSDKKNAKTKKYLITVPLLAKQGYPACEYTVTVEDGKVGTIGIEMIAECGNEGWPSEVLGYRAADYYQSLKKEMPPYYGVEEKGNKDISVRLYEDREDHIATWGMYRMDRSGKGYDELTDPEASRIIDFIKQ